ncbi:MAG: rhomboid family intramembrane serine protease [Betaproteobacteria bacterium]|nr:rhomboid family intramembrane serine protease [Betaproteobacteria bacterium]
MFYALPPITRALIAANVVLFFADNFLGDALSYYFALWPIGSPFPGRGYFGFSPWQLLTYSFLHASFWHLFVNMFALYMFGGELERLWGPARFLNLYLASVIAAAITQLVFSSVVVANPYPTVGASGGVFGLLLGYARYFPHRTIVLLIPPIPMPAWLFVTLYGLLELYLGVTGTQAGVAHFAHLGGMLGSWLLIQYWRGRPPFGGR